MKELYTVNAPNLDITAQLEHLAKEVEFLKRELYQSQGKRCSHCDLTFENRTWDDDRDICYMCSRGLKLTKT